MLPSVNWLKRPATPVNRIDLLAEGPVSSGFDRDKRCLPSARCVPAPAELRARFQPDESENIEVFLVPIEQAYERLGAFSAAGDCIDLKMFGFLERAKAVISTQSLQSGSITEHKKAGTLPYRVPASPL